MSKGPAVATFRERLAEIAERTPDTLAVRAGTPITTTLRVGERDQR